jgi:hypothetical protein
VSEAARPTRLLIALSVFLAGLYPPLLFLIVAGLNGSRPMVVLPMGLVAWQTVALLGLWRPATWAWEAALAFLLAAAAILLLVVPAALEDRGTTRLAAAAFAYQLCALGVAVGLRRPWRAWRDDVSEDAALRRVR